MQCPLVSYSTKLGPRFDLAGATVAEPGAYLGGSHWAMPHPPFGLIALVFKAIKLHGSMDD